MTRREEYQAQTVAQLRKLAREAGITGVSDLRKAELVDRLVELEAEKEEIKPEPPSDKSDERILPARPYFGFLLQLVGALGLLLSILAAIALPLAGARAGRFGADALSAGAETARQLALTVRTSRASIEAAASGLTNASQALNTVEQGLTNSDPLLGSVGELLGEELPVTIETTRAALIGAQGGAAAMDRVLRSLAFLGLEYDPEQPLDESMAETADSLEPLPDSLRGVEGDLAASREDLDAVRADLDELADDLQQLGEELGAMAASLEGYAGDLTRAGQGLERASQRAPTVGRWVGGLGAVIALGLAASQYVTIVVGGLLRRGI